MSTDPPPPPPPSAPLPPPPPPPSVGRIGTPKSPGITILLTIVTLGVWSLLWVWRVQEDYKRYRGDGVGGWLGLVIYIVVSPVTWFLVANEVQKLYEGAGEEPPMRTIWGLWFLLPIIGNFVWYLRVQRSLNEFWVARGAPAA